MTTAQVDKGNVAADGHFLLVFLLQLKGLLQVLVRRQQDSVMVFRKQKGSLYGRKLK